MCLQKSMVGGEDIYSQSVCVCVCVCVSVHALSHVQLCGTPCTVAHQALLSMGFPWQEYWSGLPFLPPGDLPDPGIEPRSLCLLHWRGDCLLFFFKFYFIFKLYNIVLVLPNIEMNPPQVYLCSPS